MSVKPHRTIYIGLAGAGSIVPAAFPIVGGWMVQQYGFNVFFGVFIVIILFAVVFIRRLNCLE